MRRISEQSENSAVPGFSVVCNTICKEFWLLLDFAISIRMDLEMAILTIDHLLHQVLKRGDALNALQVIH